jgi:hypothetical protein
MYGYIPLGLILAGSDPYGPGGLLSGRKPPRRIHLRWLHLFRLRRLTPDPVPQASLTQQCCAASSRPAS